MRDSITIIRTTRIHAGIDSHSDAAVRSAVCAGCTVEEQKKEEMEESGHGQEVRGEVQEDVQEGKWNVEETKKRVIDEQVSTSILQ